MRALAGLTLVVGAIYGGWYGAGMMIRTQIVNRYESMKQKIDRYAKASHLESSLLPEKVSASDLQLSGFPFSWTFTLPPLDQRAWEEAVSKMGGSIVNSVADRLGKGAPEDNNLKSVEMRNSVTQKITDVFLLPFRKIDLNKHPAQIKVTWASLRHPHTVQISTKGAPIKVDMDFPGWGREQMSLTDTFYVSKNGIEKMSGAWSIGEKTSLLTGTYEGGVRPYKGKLSFALTRELLDKIQEKFPDFLKSLTGANLEAFFPLKVDAAGEVVYPKECPDSLKNHASSDASKCFPMTIMGGITFTLGKDTVTFREQGSFAPKVSGLGVFEGAALEVTLSMRKHEMDRLVSIISSLAGQTTIGMVVGSSLGFLFFAPKDATSKEARAQLDIKLIDNKLIVNGMPLPLPESTQLQVREALKSLYEFLLKDKRGH